MKKKKSKIRQNKSYNKKSKFRREKSKKKMIGGSIYDTQSVFDDILLEENVRKENERLKIQLSDINGLALKYAAEVDHLKQDLARAQHEREGCRMLARKRLKTITDQTEIMNDQTETINHIKEMAGKTEPQDSHIFLEEVRKVLLS